MISKKLVLTTVEQHIAKIELNSPQNNNALSPEMIEQLTYAFEQSENNAQVHVILLFTKHTNFCSGADLKHMLSLFHKNWDENLEDAKKFAGIFLRIYNCKKPVICCVHGNISAGALGLISVCDITIADQNAKFQFPEVKLSGVPYAISPFIVKRIGYAHATKLMLTAEAFDAAEAKSVGLIDHLAPNSLHYGLIIALEIQKNNISSMIETKRWLRAISPIDKNILEESTKFLAQMRMSEKTKEAITNVIKSKI